MKCKICGTELLPGNIFCQECGAPINSSMNSTSSDQNTISNKPSKPIKERGPQPTPNAPTQQIHRSPHEQNVKPIPSNQPQQSHPHIQTQESYTSQTSVQQQPLASQQTHPQYNNQPHLYDNKSNGNKGIIIAIIVAVTIIIVVGMLIFFFLMKDNKKDTVTIEETVSHDTVYVQKRPIQTEETLSHERPRVGSLKQIGFEDDYSDIVCYHRLTDSDLRGLNKTELRILRNTIYARHGRKFKSEDLRRYFNNFDWYIPRYDEISPNALSEIEKHNIMMIQKYE